MKNGRNVAFGFLLFLSGAMISCSGDKTEKQSEDGKQKIRVLSAGEKLTVPLPGVEVPVLRVKVDAVKGGKVKLPDGGSITVPENAFVDSAGEKIKGEVELQYREMHNIADIMVSAIPMTFETGKGTEHFITAGMFDLKGTQEGREVLIVPGKKLEVQMASYDGSKEAMFYKLDPKTNKWKEAGESVTRAVEADKNQETDARIPSKADRDVYKFNIAADYSKFPEISQFEGILWQHVPEEGFGNPETGPVFEQEQWLSAELVPYQPEKKQYELILKSKTKVFVSIVTPVLGDRDYKKAQARFKKDIRQYEKELKAEAGENARKAEIIRQVSISEFGTYNHDYFYRASQPVVTRLQIKVKDKEVKPESLTAFLVMKAKNAVIRYEESGYDNFDAFTYDAADKNALIVVLPDRKIAVFDSEKFGKAAQKGKDLVLEIDHTTEVASLSKMSAVISAL